MARSASTPSALRRYGQWSRSEVDATMVHLYKIITCPRSFRCRLASVIQRKLKAS